MNKSQAWYEQWNKAFSNFVYKFPGTTRDIATNYATEIADAWSAVMENQEIPQAPQSFVQRKLKGTLDHLINSR